MPKVTGEQVKAAVIAANIEYVDHHDCGGCGYMTQYLREGDRLYFDPGCYCSRYGPTMTGLRTWDDAAEWINMQSDQEVRDKLRLRFGLPAEEQANG